MVAETEKVDGKELFRELLTVYPGAAIEDYFKTTIGGGWLMDELRIDLQIIKAHRREAGAPDPIPIEDVVLPEIPKVVPMARVTGMAATAYPAGTGFVRPAAPVITPAGATGGLVSRPVVKPLAKPAGAVTGTIGAKAGAATAGTVGAAGGPSAELKAIALFIHKWKLDPAKAKLLLARVTPAKRKWVMENYKGTGTLEQCVAQSSAAVGGAAPAAAATGATSSGMAPTKPKGPPSALGRPAVAPGSAPGTGRPTLRPVVTKPKPGGPTRLLVAAPKIGALAAPKAGGQAAAGVAATSGLGVKRPLGAAAAAPVDAKRPKLTPLSSLATGGSGLAKAKAPGAKAGVGFGAGTSVATSSRGFGGAPAARPPLVKATTGPRPGGVPGIGARPQINKFGGAGVGRFGAGAAATRPAMGLGAARPVGGPRPPAQAPPNFPKAGGAFGGGGKGARPPGGFGAARPAVAGGGLRPMGGGGGPKAGAAKKPSLIASLLRR